MEKRYICFTCYAYHPEMRGISEEEFNAGNKTCGQEKCSCKGQEFGAAEYCEPCETMFRTGEHVH